MATPSWNCTLEKIADGKDMTDLYVGDKFLATCVGSEVALSKDTLNVVNADKKDSFAKEFAVLEVKNLTPQNIQMVVASYKSGKFASGKLILTDGKNDILLDGLNYEIKTVLQPGAQPTPFGPFGAFTLSISWFYWVLLAALIAGIAYRAYNEFKKWQTRKRLFEELKNYKTARTPYDELHFDLRKLERSFELQKIKIQEYVSSLERSYRLYLIRELEVPALDWSDTEIVKEVRRRHKQIYKLIRKDLIDYFAEMRKVKKDLKTEDASYLVKNCQKISDKISDLRSQKGHQNV